MNKIFLLTMILTLLTTGCASTSKSTLFGMSVGIGAGALTGAIVTKNKKDTMKGALALGLVGALAGWFSHEALEKRDERVRKETIFNLEKFGVQMPYMNQSRQSKSSKDVYIFTEDLRGLE